MLLLYNPVGTTAYEGQILFDGMDMSNGAGPTPHQGPWTMHCSQQAMEQHQQQLSGMLMPTSTPWGEILDQTAEKSVPQKPSSQESSDTETNRKVRTI